MAVGDREEQRADTRHNTINAFEANGEYPMNPFEIRVNGAGQAQ